MEAQNSAAGMVHVTLFSFGFKYGLPTDINFLWDVRFLPNPFWVDSLRERTGEETDVAEYAIGNEVGREFLRLLEPMICFLVEKNKVDSKGPLVLAVGCTGGRHRSVAVVESLRSIFDKQSVTLTVFHRDIEKG